MARLAAPPPFAPPEGLTRGRIGDAADSAVVAAAARGLAGRPPKLAALLRRAAAALNAHDHREGARLALKALDLDDEDAEAAHLIAIALDKGGHTAVALDMYQRALERRPNDPQIALNLGMLAWRLKMLPQAERLFAAVLRLDPGCLAATVNHANVLRDQGRVQEAIDALHAAVLAAPEKAELWNALAAAAVEKGLVEEPIAFLAEALRLAPGFGRAHHNIGYALQEAGRPAEAVAHYRAALETLSDPADLAECRHALALAALAAGDLATGWAEHEVRLSPRFSQTTQFLTGDLPLWDGRDPAGLRLLAFGEQGLGDEVLFASVLPDLIAAGAQVTLACAPRLVGLFARSFPAARVVAHGTAQSGHGAVRAAAGGVDPAAFDAWAPLATIAAHLRPDVAAFPAANPFLTPDPARVARWRAWAEGLGGRPVGLCWTSLLATGKRARAYCPFARHEGLARLEGVRLVALQYGDIAADLAYAQEAWGAPIAVPPDLDLKDDLEGVAALCAALGLVVGPMNATTNLAAGAGARCLIVSASRTAWSFLGSGRLPWYPTAAVFAKDAHDGWDGVMAALTAAVAAPG